MPAAPASDGGLDVLEVPLQGPFALGAAPAAIVLAGREHPPQPQLTQGLAAHPQPCTGVGRGDPDPMAPAWGREDRGIHQPSPRTMSTTAGFQRI